MAVDHANIVVIDSKETWEAKLKESTDNKKIIVVDFTATWCGPCRLIAPIFEELSKKYDNLLFLKVDVDEYQEIASAWEVRAMPTFLFIKEGKLLDKIVGANRDELERMVDGFAKETPENQFPESHSSHGNHAHHVAHIEA